MENVAELKVYGSSVIELDGAVAQLGEHLLCKQGVSGSIPLSSTIYTVLTLSQLTLLRSGRAAERSAWSSGPVWWRTEFCLLKKK